jgi:NAD(P)-dependent dehydrogenase (short-subunit alcohol dehydrogenase family)
MQLLGKVALITGSSRGIGKAIATVFAGAGASVAVAAKHRSGAEAVAAELARIGRSAIALELDVSERSSVREAIGQILNAFGRLDILVNNAGIYEQKPFEDLTEDDWEEIFGVNMKGVYLCTQEALPLMKKQMRGKIINLASGSGLLGSSRAVHYSAAKAGVICFTKSLAKICAPYRINVNAIAPGFIETDMTREMLTGTGRTSAQAMIPLNRFGTAEEVAKLALFLASNDSDYMTGQTIVIDGGQCMWT